MNTKLTTQNACRVAGIDRSRFNEAVAQGFYPCAPITVPGRTRLFDVNDICTLWVYGRLLEEGVTPRRAGRVACGLRKLLFDHPAATRIVHVLNSSGSSIWLRREDLSIDCNVIGGASIVSAKEWFLVAVRETNLSKALG